MLAVVEGYILHLCSPGLSTVTLIDPRYILITDILYHIVIYIYVNRQLSSFLEAVPMNQV